MPSVAAQKVVKAKSAVTKLKNELKAKEVAVGKIEQKLKDKTADLKKAESDKAKAASKSDKKPKKKKAKKAKK
jgi:uncharacterized membrane protein